MFKSWAFPAAKSCNHLSCISLIAVLAGFKELLFVAEHQTLWKQPSDKFLLLIHSAIIPGRNEVKHLSLCLRR
jgi:hypothetical protein